jgi:hypothetical protein
MHMDCKCAIACTDETLNTQCETKCCEIRWSPLHIQKPRGARTHEPKRFPIMGGLPEGELTPPPTFDGIYIYIYILSETGGLYVLDAPFIFTLAGVTYGPWPMAHGPWPMTPWPWPKPKRFPIMGGLPEGELTPPPTFDGIYIYIYISQAKREVCRF